MSVYNPTGSGAVHTDKVISGGRQKMAAKKANPFAAMAAKKAGAKVPAKKVAAKAAPFGKKAAPFAKKMSDAACPPGTMPVKGAKVAKKAAKAMGELPNGTMKTPRQQRAATPGKRINRVGTTAGKRTTRVTGGTDATTGSREN